MEDATYRGLEAELSADDLLGLQIPGKLPADFTLQLAAYARHADTVNLHALGLGLACVALLA